MSSGNEYRGYLIDFDPPPIPSRDCDWHYTHKDFDGPGDNRFGHAPSYEACIEAINDLMDDADG